MAGDRLLAGFESRVDPGRQHAVEAAMLHAAHRGEIRLHVSAIEGAALALGAHAPVPVPIADAAGAVAFRRRTGGRPIACGDAFRLVTLALPRRTSLLGDDAASIAPEQVMNRAVRGLQSGLRRLGLDPSYPGLDFVTVAGRSIAHLAFAETDRGAVLFQATLACEATLAESTRLLDRLDPGGVVPTTPIPPSTATSLGELGVARGPAGPAGDGASGTTGAIRGLAPEALARVFAASWAEPAGLAVVGADPPLGGEAAPDAAETDGPFPPAPAGTTVATAPSRLGIALAWARAVDGRIEDAAVGGDVLARDGARARIARALEGCATDRAAIGLVLDATLDRERTWLLGVTPAELAGLLACAARGDA